MGKAGHPPHSSESTPLVGLGELLRKCYSYLMSFPKRERVRLPPASWVCSRDPCTTGAFLSGDGSANTARRRVRRGRPAKSPIYLLSAGLGASMYCQGEALQFWGAAAFKIAATTVFAALVILVNSTPTTSLSACLTSASIVTGGSPAVKISCR